MVGRERGQGAKGDLEGRVITAIRKPCSKHPPDSRYICWSQRVIWSGHMEGHCEVTRPRSRAPLALCSEGRVRARLTCPRTFWWPAAPSSHGDCLCSWSSMLISLLWPRQSLLSLACHFRSTQGKRQVEEPVQSHTANPGRLKLDL